MVVDNQLIIFGFLDEKDFNRQVNRNLKAIELEKAGNVKEAIKLYEMNIKENFEGNHPYDRLAIIYRRNKHNKHKNKGYLKKLHSKSQKSVTF